MVSEELIEFFSVLVFPGLLFLLSLAFFGEWLDRKVVAKLQNRYGPLHTGPHGVLQPLADFVKLLSKEDITPEGADRVLFSTAPILILALPLTALFMVPIAASSALISFDGDLVVIMFIMTLITLITFMGAWSSTNLFGTIGGMRLSLQLLGYEIPLTIAMIGPAVSARSLSLSRIVQSQASGFWFLATQPLGFIVLVVSLLAELQMVPFDVPKAETEIVTGWLVEFSGKKLALVRLAKNLELVLSTSLMTSLYLGGPLGFQPIPPPVYYLLKLIVCVLILSNLRALFARFRIDQVLKGAWLYLVPLALLQVVLVNLAAVVMP